VRPPGNYDCKTKALPSPEEKTPEDAPQDPEAKWFHAKGLLKEG
jgi:hypothetical protein